MRDFFKRATSKISKLTPEQLEVLIDTMTEENETLQAVLQSLHTGLIVCNSDWLIESKNKAVSRYIPMSLFHKHELVWESIKNSQIAEFLKKNSTMQKKYSTEEFLIFDSDGNRKFLSVEVYTLVRSRKLWGYIIQIDDITEKRKQDMLIRRMESLAGLTNLAASVAHEIKNPLGAISIHIQLIQKSLKKAREGNGMLPNEKFAERYLNVVNEEIDRLNQIIVDFLSAVRPVKPVVKGIDPSEVILSFINVIEPQLDDKNIVLTVSLMNMSPYVIIDPKLFNQVLVNLAQNSIAAMPNGGNLEITTTVKDDKFVLVFKDSGIGMSEEIIEKIYEPYFTTKTQGTGLGLSFVYKIIKEMAGNISVKSKLKEGTEFTLTFPIYDREQRLLECKKQGFENCGECEDLK